MGKVYFIATLALVQAFVLFSGKITLWFSLFLEHVKKKQQQQQKEATTNHELTLYQKVI